MNETIKNALLSAAAEALNGETVEWSDKDFTPPTKKKYFSVSLFPSAPQRLYVGSGDSHRYIGILQILVSAPKGGGVDPAMLLAQAVVDKFPVDNQMGPVRVRARPAIGPGYLNGNHYSIPVSIEYAGNM